MRRIAILLVSLALRSTIATWRDPEGFEDGQDLEHFVTRPDLTAPRYNVTKYRPEAITDGFWFVSPYSGLFHQAGFVGRKEHKTCQTGAHIYDGAGALVWSGACKYDNRNVYGFKPIWMNGSQYLSFHLDGEDLGDNVNKHSAGIVLDEHYEEVSRIEKVEDGWIDFHEFNVLPGGETALVTKISQKDVDEAGIPGGSRVVVNCGFNEVDLSTGETGFTWDALSHGVELSESWDMIAKEKTDQTWDFLHCNAVDKDAQGDYYLSCRHTSTIYMISGVDGQIIWRLGGFRPDFEMAEGTHFQYQHHVRVRERNATHTLLTVFDNHAIEASTNPLAVFGQSSAKFLLLDTTRMTASLLRHFPRPDGKSSPKLGSVQVLGEDAATAPIFVDWALQGYISEYDSSNRLLFEAKFESNRMSSYRAYKYSFIGRPTELPRCKIMPIAIGQEGRNTASTFYVSWNGATEVAQWAFYGAGDEHGPFEKLATVNRTGFETSFSASGFIPYGYAEAIDGSGTALNRSTTVATAPSSNGASISIDANPYGADFTAGGAEFANEQAEDSDSWRGWQLLYEMALYVLALVGLYAGAKRLAPALSRWHRGYQPLDKLPT